MLGNPTLSHSHTGLGSLISTSSHEQNNLKNILETIPSAAMLVDAEGRCLYVNNRGREIYGMHDSGFRMDEHIKAAKALWLDGQQVSLENLPVCQAFQSGQTVCNVEMHMQDASGALYPVRVSSSPLYGADGKINCIIVIIEDIKRAEKELYNTAERLAQNIEEKYRMLYENMDDGFCVIEIIFNDAKKPVDWRYLDTNSRFINQGGFPDAAGNLLSELNYEVEPFWYELYGNVAISGVPARRENELKALSKWYDIYAFKIGGPESHKVGVLFRDVTERKRAEEALQKNEKRKAFLLMLSDMLRPLSAPHEIHAAVTRAAMDYFGSDRCYYCEIKDDNAIIRQDSARGDLPSVASVYPLSALPIHRSLIDAGLPFMISNVKTTDQVDEDLRQLCIQLQIISYLDVPVVKGGKPVGLLCIVQSAPRDWTESEAELAIEVAERTWAAVERGHAEEALQRSESQAHLLATELEKKNRLVTDFFINISHEFKTPLTILMLGLELLETKAKKMKDGGKAFVGNLTAMKQNSYRLNRLVGNLLDITKLDAGFMRPKWEHIDVAVMMRSLVQSVEPYTQQRQLALTYQCNAAEIPFTTDSFMLERIVLNLLSNAIKHTPAAGKIHLECRAYQEGIFVEVRDTGEGIPDDKKAIIFDRFSQVDTKMTRSSEGTGIGLALTKSFVELLGGRISVESKLKVGSAFVVELPVVRQVSGNGIAKKGGMQIDKRVQMELSDISLN